MGAFPAGTFNVSTLPNDHEISHADGVLVLLPVGYVSFGVQGATRSPKVSIDVCFCSLDATPASSHSRSAAGSYDDLVRKPSTPIKGGLPP